MTDLIMPTLILNDEGLELTKRAVESFGKVNLIIIDNASPIGGGYLRSVADTYIRNKENLGYSKAVNQGLKLSPGDLKAIANNDVRVSDNWQDVAEEIFDDNPKAYSVHFRMIPYDQEFNPGDLTAETGRERWCSSSFFVIRTTHPKLYDENFFNSYDDWDMWTRVRNDGWQTVYTNKAEYQHHDSFTQSLLPERAANNEANREYFISKWGYSPEEKFEQDYPKQVKEPWKPFP